MLKITLRIQGMACGMCESHMNAAVRSAFPVKKVTSSHSKQETVIIADEMPDMLKMREMVTSLGYTLLSYHEEPYEKKGFFAKLTGR